MQENKKLRKDKAKLQLEKAEINRLFQNERSKLLEERKGKADIKQENDRLREDHIKLKLEIKEIKKSTDELIHEIKKNSDAWHLQISLHSNLFLQLFWSHKMNHLMK